MLNKLGVGIRKSYQPRVKYLHYPGHIYICTLCRATGITVGMPASVTIAGICTHGYSVCECLPTHPSIGPLTHIYAICPLLDGWAEQANPDTETMMTYIDGSRDTYTNNAFAFSLADSRRGI